MAVFQLFPPLCDTAWRVAKYCIGQQRSVLDETSRRATIMGEFVLESCFVIFSRFMLLIMQTS